MTDFQGCCTALGGEVEDILCKGASLLGRDYNVTSPCEYLEAGEEARASFPFGGVAYDVGLFFGSVSAFLIPSTSKFTPSIEGDPPLTTTYKDVAQATAEHGLKVAAVLLVVVLYIANKYTK